MAFGCLFGKGFGTSNKVTDPLAIMSRSQDPRFYGVSRLGLHLANGMETTLENPVETRRPWGEGEVGRVGWVGLSQWNGNHS